MEEAVVNRNEQERELELQQQIVNQYPGDYYFRADLSTPGWADQNWDRDRFGNTPMYEIAGNDSDKNNTLGDFLPETVVETGRDASSETNMPPWPTRRYSDYSLQWGGQMEPELMPQGPRFATDRDFWGATNWNAERPHKLPAYVFDTAGELNGKDINRPLDTYFSDFDPVEGEMDVSYSSGNTSGRTPNAKLTALNRYGSFVTSKPAVELKFTPPRANAPAGGGMPPEMAKISLGARVARVFSAFKPWRDMGRMSAPAIAAEVTLPAKSRYPKTYQTRYGSTYFVSPNYGSESINTQEGRKQGTRLHFETRISAADKFPGGHAPAGPDDNTHIGGAVRRLIGQWNTMGNPAYHKTAANSGTEQNPPDQGYGYGTRLRIKPESETSIGAGSAFGGTAPLLLARLLGKRPRKDGGDRSEHVSIGGGMSVYGGENKSGLETPQKTMSGFVLPVSMSSAAGGAGGKPTVRGMWTLHGNTAKGTRGATWSNEPSFPELQGAMRSALGSSILGKRSESELDDLFAALHS